MCVCSSNGLRLVLPSNCVVQVCQQAMHHDMAHPGYDKTLALICIRFLRRCPSTYESSTHYPFPEPPENLTSTDVVPSEIASNQPEPFSPPRQHHLCLFQLNFQGEA
ncbi:hypothetical protein ElyMa_004897400 [Elysia marginata]|uniref:Integrase zinc-binding domain-containing protein n=1 Tax=Elysia marginata TaxID=1093978 RepID=A0AAV4IWB8_9GAST|nr:hypothetical protein ElyMa_004897400 [Elysia marginata]